MEILVKSIADSLQEKRDEQGHNGKRLKLERRRNPVDRRKSINEGVVVSLSSRKERRSFRDRRKKFQEQLELVKAKQKEENEPQEKKEDIQTPNYRVVI